MLALVLFVWINISVVILCVYIHAVHFSTVNLDCVVPDLKLPNFFRAILYNS